MAFTVQPLKFTHHQVAVDRKWTRWGSETAASTGDVIRRMVEGKGFVLGGARGCGKASLMNEICLRILRQPDRALALGPVSAHALALRGIDSLGSQLRDWFRDGTKHLELNLGSTLLAALPGRLSDWLPYLRQISARVGAQTIVLLVTDLECVPAADRDRVMRDLLDFLSATKLRTAMGCSGNLLEDEVSSISGETGGGCDRYMLGSFDESEMETFLVQASSDFGYTLAPAAREAVVCWTNSVPYFVHSLMLSVTSLALPSGTTITPDIIARAAAEMPPILMSRFAQPLRLLEHRALTSNHNGALGHTQDLISIMNRAGAAEVDWDYPVVRNLRRWGLVRRDVQDRMVWATPLLTHWFQQAGPFIGKMPWVVDGLQLLEDRALALRQLHLQDDNRKDARRDYREVASEAAHEAHEDSGAPAGEQCGTEDVVGLVMRRQAAIELLNAMVVNLGAVPTGQQEQAGGDYGEGYGAGKSGEAIGDGEDAENVIPIDGGQPASGGKGAGDRKRRGRPAIVEEVDSTVYAPIKASPNNSFLVQVFVHLPEHAAALDAIAKAAEPDASKRVGTRLEHPIERGTELLLNLTMPGLEIDEPSQACIWRGEPEAVQFGVTVPAGFKPKDMICTVMVCQNSVPIGRLKFKFSVVADAVAATSLAPVLAGNLLRYKQAFICYASADRPEVLKRVQMLNLVKLKFFQDLLTLEPGDVWESRIYRYIDASDVVFLFWSKAASESDWVAKELAYAKSRQAGNDAAPPDIVPVIIEGPPPAKPPAQLNYLHFNDRFIYFISAVEGHR